MPDKYKEPPGMLIRGFSLISLFEYVMERLEIREVEFFFTRLPRKDTLMIQRAQKGEWYPFRLQRLMREQIAAQFNPDDPWTAVFDAGLFAAERETSTFLKAMLSYSSVGFILKHTATFWKKYNNTGRAQGRQIDEHRGVVELFDFPGDELFCPMMQAWLVAAGQMLKLKDANVKETACVHRGDNLCRWEISW